MIIFGPCGFCGGRTQPPQNYGDAPGYHGRFVECENSNCHAMMYRYRDTPEEADTALSEAWNTRISGVCQCEEGMTDPSDIGEQQREKLAAWMMLNGFATGHGDTIDDLLGELAAQVSELKAVHLAARDLITKGLRNDGLRLMVVEATDNSDPHYRLCEALEKIAPLNPGRSR